tara:strand:+ start:69 stop:788 length:720 start_codon:yes stop_codon:yes gene_type:complete
MSVAGDGACFFHSIAAILIKEGNPIKINGKLIEEKTRGKLAIKLRAECVKWLRKNLYYRIKGLDRTISEEILSEIEDGSLDKKINTLSKYLTYMSRYDSYAGQIEIYSMSNLLNRNIRVYIHNKRKFSNVGLGYEVKNKDIMDDIFLYHNLGKTKSKGLHHFEPLYPKVKAVKDVKKIKKNNKVSTKYVRKPIKKRSVRQSVKNKSVKPVRGKSVRKPIKKKSVRKSVKNRSAKRSIRK